jgi:lipopolysaccharide biosynthesis glycosyltransferase
MIKKIDENIPVNCYYIKAPIEICIERDFHRAVCDKTIGEEIIRTFAKKEQIPTEEEGFNKLVIYENNTGIKPGGFKEKKIEDIEVQYDEVI